MFATWPLVAFLMRLRRNLFHTTKLLRAWKQVNTGIIMVLDIRILTKQYGQSFLDALPECPVEIV
jgi:hypothetical protein